MVTAQVKFRPQASGYVRQMGKGDQRQDNCMSSSSSSSCHLARAVWGDSKGEHGLTDQCRGVSMCEVLCKETLWGRQAFLPYQHLSYWYISNADQLQRQLRMGKAPMISCTFVPANFFPEGLDLVPVSLCGHAATIFQFSSASGSSKMEKGLFQVMWFGCRRANDLSWIGKRKPFWGYLQEYPVKSHTSNICSCCFSCDLRVSHLKSELPVLLFLSVTFVSSVR